MPFTTTKPVGLFTDINGKPLDGQVFFGQPNLDPIANPITVYWDAAGTQPVTQPVVTVGGYPMNGSTRSNVFVNADYSILVRNRNGFTVFSAPNLPFEDSSDNQYFLQAGSGAVQRTVQSKLRDVVSVKDFGAVGDGVADDTAAFIAARAAANGKRIYAPAGTYKLNQVITGSTDLVFEGDGPATILDFTGTITGGSYALEAIGSTTQIQALSGIQTVGTNTVTFASAPSLSVGDVFVIFNPTNSSWSGFRTNYFAGEWCEVESISGSVVTVRNQLYDTYAAADVDVYKIIGPKVVLRNFDIRGTTVFGLIAATFCLAPLIENIKASHSNNSVVYFDRCFKPTFINPNISNTGDGGDDYGVVVGNSQHVKIIGGFAYGRRHGIAAGGGVDICSVPTRDMRVQNVVIKNDPDSNIGSANFHGNCEDCSFDACTIYGGAILAGKDTTYSNCKITNSALGYVALFGEIKGGRHGLVNCDLVTYIDPMPNTMGILEIGGAGTAVSANTSLDCLFFSENCNIYGRNQSSSTSFVVFKNKGSNVSINFNINGIAANLNALGQILYTENTSGTAASDFIVVDNISNFPSSTLLHNANAASYRDFPHRLQKQTGRVTLAATSGTTETISAPVNFKYIYPRIPAAFSTSGGAVGQTYIGNRPAIANLYEVTTSAIRPQITSGDLTNWSATLDVGVSWSAMIDEV